MTESDQDVKAWYDVLNWEELPNFGGCQNYPPQSFQAQYYINKNLRLIINNFLEVLSSERANKGDVRLMGNPGVGKTSFLYCLSKIAEQGEHSALKKYVFHIFHISRANAAEYKECIRSEILEAWRKLYFACGERAYFEMVTGQVDKSKKEMLNIISNNYKSNRASFNKFPVFILDDVDLLDNEMAHEVISAVKQDLEMIQAMIWISIRDETFNKYPAKTKKLLIDMFSKQVCLPEVPLFKIIEHRIKAVSKGTGKNPFSESLCKDIEVLTDGQKRRGLAALCNIISENPPKGIQLGVDETFIQPHIERAAVSTLIKHGDLPNIHLKHLRSLLYYPLPMDILGCCKHSSDKRIISACVGVISTQRSKFSKMLEDKKISPNKDEIQETTHRMIEEGLIVEYRDDLSLSSIGHALYARISNSNKLYYYNEKCLENISSLDNNDLYNSLIGCSINYKDIVNKHILWNM